MNSEGQIRGAPALNITHIREFCFKIPLRELKSFRRVSASCQQALSTTEVSIESILAALMCHLQALHCSADLLHSFFSSISIFCCFIKDKHSLSERVAEQKERRICY